MHVKGVVELVNIAHDLIAAKLGRRVWINGQSASDLFRSRLVLPDLSPGEKETLGPRESVDDRRLFSVQGNQVCLPGDTQSPEVSNVLANGQRAIHMLTGSLVGRERVVLVNER